MYVPIGYWSPRMVLSKPHHAVSESAGVVQNRICLKPGWLNRFASNSINWPQNNETTEQNGTNIWDQLEEKLAHNLYCLTAYNQCNKFIGVKRKQTEKLGKRREAPPTHWSARAAMNVMRISLPTFRLEFLTATNHALDNNIGMDRSE